MGLTTLALVGLGLAAGYGGAKALTKGSNTATGARRDTANGTRTPPPGAEYTGDKAVRREDLAASQLAGTNPPDAALLASSNVASARTAGERQRKRAAAGGSLLTGAQKGQPGPGGGFAPKTLLGS